MIIAFAFKANVDTYLQAAVDSIHRILNELNEIDCTERKVWKGRKERTELMRFKSKRTLCKARRIKNDIYKYFLYIYTYIYNVYYIYIYAYILHYTYYIYTHTPYLINL